MLIEELPFVLQSPGDGPQSRFSAIRSTPHKGSKSSSSQSTSTTTKDNSAVAEDEAIVTSDGSAASKAEDEAVSVSGGGQVSQKELAENAFAAEGNSRVNKDNLIGAGGGVSLAHSQISVEQIGDDVVKDALDFGGKALDFSTYTVEESLKVGSAGLEDAYEQAQISQEAANRLSRTTNEIIAGIARENSEDSDSEIFADLQRNLLIGGGILAAVILVINQPWNK